MNSKRNRKALNAAFKQFQRLPDWRRVKDMREPAQRPVAVLPRSNFAQAAPPTRALAE